MTKKSTNYAALNTELEAILDQLQSGNLDIDQALTAYKRGQTIVAELQSYLKSAENQIKKVTAK